MEKSTVLKKHLPKQYKYLGIITVIYITLLIVANTSAGKIVQIGFFTTTAPDFFFPATYIIADILTEVYGYARARSVLWKVILSQIIMSALYFFVVSLPPAPGFTANDAYSTVLGQVPRIVLASLIAMFAGGILNDFILAKMKVRMGGKRLWMRTIGSTIVGEGVDTVLFFVIGLYGVIPTGLLITTIINGWLLKVAVEIVMTPVTYWVVGKLKKMEKEDFYDKNTNFNPLIIE